MRPNTHRRRDSTVELSRVGGVYEIRNYKIESLRYIFAAASMGLSSLKF